jgi:LysM repeat protein
VVYVIQPGDSLASIAAIYDIPASELQAANCFNDNQQIKAGQGLFVPFDLILSPTPSPRVIFSSLNTSTITPTKKPTRKPANPTQKPVQEFSPTPAPATATTLPPTSTPPELPTLAPTQVPPPPPPPTQEN